MTHEELYETIQRFGWNNFIRIIQGDFYDIDAEEDLPFQFEVVSASAELHLASGETTDKQVVIKIQDEFWAVGFYGDSWDEAIQCDSFTLSKVVPKEKTIVEYVSL